MASTPNPYGTERRQKLLRLLACVVCGKVGVQLAHVHSRGSGGGAGDIVPLCPAHHAEQHTLGIASFQARYEIDLEFIASQLEELLDGLE